MENKTLPAPLNQVVGPLRKGDGDFIRSICDFSSVTHARRLRRIAAYIDSKIFTQKTKG